MIYAAQSNSYETVKYLIEHGADVHFTNADNQSVLWYALEENNSRLVEILLSYGMDINLLDSWKEGYLHSIASIIVEDKEQQLSIYKRLIGKGIQFSMTDLGNSPLHDACGSGNESLVKEILKTVSRTKLRTALNTENPRMGTPLYIAAFCGSFEIVQMLLDTGADFEAGWKGETPWEVAKQRGHRLVARLIKQYINMEIIKRLDPGGCLLMFPSSRSGSRKKAKLAAIKSEQCSYHYEYLGNVKGEWKELWLEREDESESDSDDDVSEHETSSDSGSVSD